MPLPPQLYDDFWNYLSYFFSIIKLIPIVIFSCNRLGLEAALHLSWGFVPVLPLVLLLTLFHDSAV